jgi:subtilisin family serine protease
VPGEGRDLFGHGTAVAGIIRAAAPEAEIGSIRVLGESLSARTAIILEGARQAIERGYHILNCSLGCGVPEHVLKYKNWVDEAYLKGVHVVAACNNLDSARPEWPGFFTSVLTVNMARTRRRTGAFLQARPAGGIRRAGRGCGRGVVGRREENGDRQQLRRASRDGPARVPAFRQSRHHPASSKGAFSPPRAAVDRGDDRAERAAELGAAGLGGLRGAAAAAARAGFSGSALPQKTNDEKRQCPADHCGDGELVEERVHWKPRSRPP